MQITIRLLGAYRQYLPEAQDGEAGYRLDLPEGTVVDQVLAELPIPQAGMSTFLVNGRHAARDQVLVEDDTLSVFPAAGGG